MPAFAALAVVGLLSACGEKDIILPGERLDIRGDLVDADAFVNQALPVSLGAATANADWTHRNGGPTHLIAHPALGTALAPVFSTNIGQGNTRRLRITADPIVASGRVFTLDAESQVVATSTAGETLWSRNLKPDTDNARDASGGGLAAAGSVILATTGFGEVVALDGATGGEIWRQDLDAPGTSAPTIVGDLAYVVARDGRAWAIELGSGRVRWTVSTTAPTANYSGGAGAAVNADVAIFPFPTGEVLAAFPEGGLRRWSTVVSGQRPGSAASNISDIAGDPVIDGNRVYVGNVSGRVVALELANGDRLWTATEGAVGPVWPAGGSLFLVNDIGELVRLDADTGTAIWRVELPGFAESRERRQKTRFAHYGPIIAGNRLIVASGDGLIRQFDPASGALVGTVEIAGGAASNPIVANGTLYVVSARGQLVAFR
ncbi:PQQ-binding-like beta-propeller repeat protein [Octadecabacter sp. 1_MG-2023]|uniref:PQQ-binding-like beta-propeller repeat protein n=1 Tax=unclassified Octadecabacter TaxID=196158 RepID=UPI001C0825CE|nr:MULTISPECIES: PQQ-binding-like beta-propeller repeat protein [unclassified Octadecabacter]MBU2993756.1 PQQ-like beta-propeller repeat protein [Octadecabacter sp. B2R22]MDO6735399.1 PQQ-binding-like beta-propeller repeat protein [Octadecabacter sp. 1_MG-2023]